MIVDAFEGNAGYIVMSVIGAAGFTEQQPGAPPVTWQPESAQTAIIVLTALAPLSLMSIGILYCVRYRLNKERHAQVLAAIESDDEAEKAAVLTSL